MAIPTIRAVGAVSAGAAAIAPGLPAGTAVGDLLVMFLESAASQPATCSGFTAPVVANEAGAVTRATVFYRIATGTDPTDVPDVGNHVQGRIIGVTAGTFDPVIPFHVDINNDQTATTAVSISGPTTTIDDCLILAFSACPGPDALGTTEFSSPANANLSDVTEQIDNSSAAGTGTGILVISGGLATAGAVGATTATAATSLVRANMCLAIAPPGTAIIRPRHIINRFAVTRASTY